MANQYLRQFLGTKEPGVVELFAYVTVGASGAPTLVTSKSKGIRSIARNSAGNYTVTLTDSYVSLLNFSLAYDSSANGPGTAPAAPIVYLYSNSVTTTGAGTVRFVSANTSGTATDPASTEAFFLSFVLKNSTAY